MENHMTLEIIEQSSPGTPPLIKFISSNEVDGFDDTFHSQFPSPNRKVRHFFTTFMVYNL